MLVRIQSHQNAHVADQCIEVYNYIGQAMSWQLLNLSDGYVHIHYSTLSTFVYIWNFVSEKL